MFSEKKESTHQKSARFLSEKTQLLLLKNQNVFTSTQNYVKNIVDSGIQTRPL